MDIAFYCDVFNDFWQAGKYEEAIKLYEDMGRPFWLSEQIGMFLEKTDRPDRAMHEYEHVINAYFKMGPDILPIPGGPLELFTLAKWFTKTDPAKAQEYLRIYISADEINHGELLKTSCRTEAVQLLEVLMKNKHDFIKQRLDKLQQCPDVIPLRGPRTMPDAMSLALRPPARIGLWWYQLESGELFFSDSAASHLKLDQFKGLTEVRGCIRGAVFQKDGLNCLLIYKCDLPSKTMEGRVLVDIYEKAQKLSGEEITGGIVDEEGRDLLGNTKDGCEALNKSV